MNALDALYRCQRAWEQTQPQLFWTDEVLWPDSGLDERHAPDDPDGQPVVKAAVPLVEPGAAASPEAAGLAPGDTEPRCATPTGLTAFNPCAAPPSPPCGGSVSPLTRNRPGRISVDETRGRGDWRPV